MLLFEIRHHQKLMRRGLNHDVLLSHFVHFSLISFKETIIIQRYVFVIIENMTPWIVNEEGGRGELYNVALLFWFPVWLQRSTARLSPQQWRCS